jgi:hypothetical protein
MEEEYPDICYLIYYYIYYYYYFQNWSFGLAANLKMSGKRYSAFADLDFKI